MTMYATMRPPVSSPIQIQIDLLHLFYMHLLYMHP